MKTYKTYQHLTNDTTLCHDIDTSGGASEHELGDLAAAAGYSSLTSLLNDWSAWRCTVGEVAHQLIQSMQEEEEE